MLNLRTTTTAILLALSFPLFGCAIFIGNSDDKNQPPAQLPQVTASDEMFARVRLIAIAKAEVQYQLDADGEYGTLEQLISKGLVGDPSKGQLARYKFEITVRAHGFEATAVPEKYGVTGDRSFFIDETNVIRAADKHGEKATVQDPPA
jgi:hypothetical protein